MYVAVPLGIDSKSLLLGMKLQNSSISALMRTTVKNQFYSENMFGVVFELGGFEESLSKLGTWKMMSEVSKRRIVEKNSIEASFELEASAKVTRDGIMKNLS